MTTTNEIDYKKATSIFDFIVKDSYGADVPLGEFCKGYVTIVVNTASTCGYTNINYAQLTQLYNDHKDSKILKNLITTSNKTNWKKMLRLTEIRILSFPCNQFHDRMEEGDGDEMLCNLKLRCASIGRVLAKVSVFIMFSDAFTSKFTQLIEN